MPDQREHQQQHNLTASLDNAEAQPYDQANAATKQSIHQVGMEKKLENQHDLRQLNDQVKQMQQTVTAKNESEVHDFNNRQDLKRQELERVQASAQPQNAMVHKNERDALEQFQRNQRDQVLNRQNLEQKVLKELKEAAEDLQARQLREQDKLARPDVMTSKEQRQQQEIRHQQERDQLNAYIDKQVQTLTVNLNDIQKQAIRDEKAFLEALYKTGQDANRQNSLKDTLDKQLANRIDLERAVEDRLFSAFAQRAFANRFSDTHALKTLWEDATKNLDYSHKKAYDRARERFWKSVNEGTSDNAKTVRKMLEKAGYELQRGSNAPLLNMAGWDHESPSRELKERQLSLDHAASQSESEKERLRSENLRFMSFDDNSRRNKFYNENDLRIKKIEEERNS